MKFSEIIGCGVVERNKREILTPFVGQQIAIIRSGLIYRGLLTEIGKDYIILSKVCFVEVTGPNDGDFPHIEDVFGGSMIIGLEAIDIAYQPRWAFAPLPE